MQEDLFYAEMTTRNIGVLTEHEQKTLRNSCVGIAGCGAIGGYAAVQLARLGIGRLKLADFDTFERSNLSRQACCTVSKLGAPKAHSLEAYLKDINPYLTLKVYPAGVQTENVGDFVSGVDFVIDGIDISYPLHSGLLHKKASAYGICSAVSQAILYGASVLVFGPGTRDFNSYFGITPNTSSPDPFNARALISKLSTRFPSYIDESLLASLDAGKSPPVIVPSVYLATSLTVHQTLSILFDKSRSPSGPDPRLVAVDLRDHFYDVKE